MRIKALVASIFFTAAIATSPASSARAAEALPAFAYSQITLRVATIDQQPVPNASLYGFCRDLNLICPRRDKEAAGRNDILWQESFLGKTAADGTLKVSVPPGRWRFFAAGSTREGTIVAAWTDPLERAGGEIVQLIPATTRHWRFTLGQSQPLSPRRLLLKPDAFPIWIPVAIEHAADSIPIQLDTGPFQIWAEGDAAPEHPGFALNFGALNDKTPDGSLAAADQPAIVDCKGGKSQAVLSWTRRDNFGLEGDLTLCDNAKVWLTPGNFTIAYRRPIAESWTATFIGQFYRLARGQSLHLDFTTPLSAALDYDLPNKPGKKGAVNPVAQLYLVDGNGHLLGRLLDAAQKFVTVEAGVTIAGHRYTARQAGDKFVHGDRDPQEEIEESDDPESAQAIYSPRWGEMLFRAASSASDAAAATTKNSAIWDFNLPPSVLPTPTLTESDRVTVTATTFKTEVPKILERDAANLLAQADLFAQTMDKVSGRKRKKPVTEIKVVASREGAVSTHDGSETTIGTRLFYSNQPTLAHTFGHELGHNFGYHHGGLHESVVELSRCAPGEQISQQPAKWLFLDKMNGIPRQERGYPNIGLYLYFYAQAGPKFLRFISTNEQMVLSKLDKHYTTDELTAAICSLGMNQDETLICRQYGLTVPQDHVTAAMREAKALCEDRH